MGQCARWLPQRQVVPVRLRSCVSVNGNELLAIDALSGAVTPMTDSNPGLASSFPGHGVRLGNQILFSADDGVVGSELHAIPLPPTGSFAAEPFGAGCGGPAVGGPRLSGTGDAETGKTFGLDLDSAPVQQTALFLLSTSNALVPLGNGCTFLLGGSPLPIAFLPTGLSGAISFGSMIPPTPGLSGLQVWFQAAIGASVLTGLSNGLEVVFGL